MPFLKPWARKSIALTEPRYGVPKVMSARVSSHPPSASMKYRATRPPIECPSRTSLAFSLPGTFRYSSSQRGAASASRWAAARLSRRQSYGKSNQFWPSVKSNSANRCFLIFP